MVIFLRYLAGNYRDNDLCGMTDHRVAQKAAILRQRGALKNKLTLNDVRTIRFGRRIHTAETIK